MGVRYASSSELDLVVQFIADNWRADHVFVRRPELLRWQHLDEARGQLNFVVAEVRGELVGLLGFIPFRRFDPSLRSHTIAGAIWKVTDHAPPGVGVQMLRFLMAQQEVNTTIAIGLSDMVVPLYRALGFTTGVMEHFAILPQERSPGPNVGVTSLAPRQSIGDLEILARSLSAVRDNFLFETESLLRANTPEKSLAYYETRFEQHPWFRYRYLLLGRQGKPKLLVVMREVGYPGGTVLRIVDVGGDFAALPRAGEGLAAMMRDADADYVDLVTSGADHDAMVAGAFTSRRSDPKLILPVYFDPYIHENADLAFAYRSTTPDQDGIHLHLADSDQDRPNS